MTDKMNTAQKTSVEFFNELLKAQCGVARECRTPGVCRHMGICAHLHRLYLMLTEKIGAGVGGGYCPHWAGLEEGNSKKKLQERHEVLSRSSLPLL